MKPDHPSHNFDQPDGFFIDRDLSDGPPPVRHHQPDQDPVEVVAGCSAPVSVDGRMTRVSLDVRAERLRQEEKWGQQDHDFPHYYQILSEELGEASRAWLEARAAEEELKRAAAHEDGDPEDCNEHRRNMRTELVQACAVLHAMIECGDRNGWWPRSSA